MKINILNYFSETVWNSSKKYAVIDGEHKITFSDLNIKARKLASRLRELDCRNKPIAVFLPKSIETIISDIAITYSANAYMNLDIKTPASRIENIIKLINPTAVITNKKLADIIREIDSGLPLIIIDDFNFEQVIEIDFNDESLGQVIDTDPLCIINTSGSTGTPKGVVLNHRSYIDYTNWAINAFSFDGSEKLGVLSPTIFDHFNFEICLMMFKGSTLVLLDNNMAMFPIKLLEKINEEQINFIFWVPSIMVNIANMDLLTKIKLPTLKMVWFAGEVFPTKQFNYWRSCLPSATFVNLYGPIETTVDCTYYVVKREIRDDEPIPIGHPCRNTDVLILNDKNEIALGSEEGELCVRGTSLAMGYYNNPEQTAISFVQNPLNNSFPEIIYRTGDIVLKNELKEIVFKGRKDSLVKHLGYRVELGEIEHIIINKLKLVNNCCIVYNQTQKEITLFYESEQEIPPIDFRKAISISLPKYMIPTVYHRLDELKRNANGKIDRLYYNNKLIINL